MKNKGSKPTTPFNPKLVLRGSGGMGVIGKYDNLKSLLKDLAPYGVTMHTLYRNTLSHGNFVRTDEDVEMGFERFARLSLRWCTGESVFSYAHPASVHLLARKSKKSWFSKKRPKKTDFRNNNTVARIQRYGKAQVVEEGEPPVRCWKESVPEPYDDWHDRRISRCWKDQSKCRKQWQRKLK